MGNGYHLQEIEKGEIGELSKIKEEIAELEDALEQNSKIMALIELSDLYGAWHMVLLNYTPRNTLI